MIKKWFEIIFDHRVSLRERMFRIVTGISMLALMFILLMGRSAVNVLILAVSLAAMSLIVKMSIRKDRIHTGATAISVLLLLLFPVSFFSAGGLVRTVLYLYLHNSGRKTNDHVFHSVHVRDTGLLLYGF